MAEPTQGSGLGHEVARGWEKRLAGSSYYYDTTTSPHHPLPPPPSSASTSVCAGKLRELLELYVCGGGGGGDTNSSSKTTVWTGEGCRCASVYFPASALQFSLPAPPSPLSPSSLVVCPCLLDCLPPGGNSWQSTSSISQSSSSLATAWSTSLRQLSGRVVGHRRRLGCPPMAPVDEHDLLVESLERYDNDDSNTVGYNAVDANNANCTSHLSRYQTFKYNNNNNNNNNDDENNITAKREPITAKNQTGCCSQNHLKQRAGSERPAAVVDSTMFSPLLSQQHAAARARSTGPVLQRKNASESNYESIDNNISSNSNSWLNTAAAVDPLPPPRSHAAAFRRLDMAVQGMEQMSWGGPADVRLKKSAALKDAQGATRHFNGDDEEKGREKQQRVQYDSITVMPASLLGRRELPPPPPLPRTRSFRQVVVAKGGDVRASSAPPVSPMVCRRTAGQSNR